MVSKSTIKQTLYDELASAMTAADADGNISVSISDAYDHVAVANGPDASNYPFMGFEDISSVPVSHGIHGHIYVISQDDTQIVYGRDDEHRFDLYVQTDENQILLKDQLYDLLDERLSRFERWKDPSDFHADVNDITVNSSTGDDRDNGVRGDRVELTIEYTQKYTYTDFDTIQSVKQTFDHDADLVYTTS